MTAWSFTYEGYEPAQERLREALCTLGNGFFATRGAAPEAAADEVHYPGTYVAGGYNRRVTHVAGRDVENEDLVNLPNWLPLSFRIDGGDWLDLGAVELLDYRQTLELRRGILRRDVKLRDPQGRTTSLEERRLVHMGQPHLAALEWTITPLDWEGTLELRTALDGRVTNSGVPRYRALEGRHLEPLEGGEVGPESLFLMVHTNQSHLRVALAARTRVYVDETPEGAPKGERRPLVRPRRTTLEPGYVEHRLEAPAARGRAVRVEKVVALYTSRDAAISECGQAARQEVARAPAFEALLRDHGFEWDRLWRRFDMQLELDDPARQARVTEVLRLHVFHLVQTTSLNSIDLDSGVPARGLTGEAYRGHIFWDELFIFPLLNLRVPEITRSLLMYRYRRLGEARAAASAQGFRGALYPWQSGSDGREETQTLHLNPRSGRWLPDHTHLQRHVNAAIAYNIWTYYQVTADVEFVLFYGAEMFLEIARFFASLATWDPDAERWEIKGVVGPDEYHEAYPGAEEPGLDNNTYTNVMAAWVLWRALEALDQLPPGRREDLCRKLNLDDARELERWDEISRRMKVCFVEPGVLSQFEGYERLEELDWEGLRARHGDIQRLDRVLEAEGDSPNHYKASKQADVLMLFYLFSADELSRMFERLDVPFDPEWIPRNIEYYLRRTSHGSTLSRVVHSWVLARLDRGASWELFSEALESDVSDVQGGTTAEGIHLGAMAGTVDLLQRCYTGIETHSEVLWLDPRLPEPLSQLRLDVRYRSQPLELAFEDGRVTVTALASAAPPIRLGYGGEVYTLSAGERLELRADAPARRTRVQAPQPRTCPPASRGSPAETAAAPSSGRGSGKRS